MFRVKLIKFFRVFKKSEQKKKEHRRVVRRFVSFDTELNKGEKYGIHYECSMKIFFLQILSVSLMHFAICLQARKIQFLRFRMESEAGERIEGAVEAHASSSH